MRPWAFVRDRWPSFVGTFVALSLGVALLTATLSVFASAQPAVPDRYAGAAVVVRSPAAEGGGGVYTPHVPWSPQRVDALAGELAAIPGVAAAVPDRSFYAQVVRDGRPLGDPPATDPLGHAWSTVALAPYRLTAGTAPRGDGEVALDEAYGVAPGGRVRLLTAAGPSRFAVVGTVGGPGIYLSDQMAGRLAAGVTAIGLVTEPGADPAPVAAAAREVAGGAGEVLTGAARTGLEPPAHAQTRWVGAQLLSTMAVLAAFAAVFVVASTFALGAHQRRRELALLRAVGALPGQVRRLMRGEALLVGAVAAVAGAVLGAALAPVLGGLLVEAGLEPPGFTARVTPLPVAAAAGTGLVVAVVAVWAASRRAVRIHPLRALREAEVDRRPMTRVRWVFGGLAVAGGVALAVVTAGAGADAAITTAAFSAMALIAGLAALAPVIVPPVARVVTLPFDRSAGAVGLLVHQYAVTAVRRTAATAGPVLLTVGFGVLILGMVQTLSPAFGDDRAARAGAALVVMPDGAPGLSDAAVAAVPGAVTWSLASTVYVDAPGGGRVAVDAAGVRAGAPGPGTMVVAQSTAARYGWAAGDTVPVTFADGRTEPVRVASVAEDGSTARPIQLTAAVVRAHDPAALVEAVFVRGADRAAVRRAVTGMGASIVDVATYAANDDEDRLVWIFALIMVGMLVGYTGIAVANTLMMATGDRRRDFAVLRRAGAGAGQVLRVVAGETLLVVGLGGALGAAVALPALLGIRSALAEAVGGPVALRLPWPELLMLVGTCAALALVASLTSTGFALRALSGRRR